MKNLKYLVIGTWFGILLTKSEAVSWFRIQEMFRFQAFHMYGIIGLAVVVGMISLLVIKKFKIKSLKDVSKSNQLIVSFSDKIQNSEQEIRSFLRHRMYDNKSVLNKNQRGKMIIKKLFKIIKSNPRKFLTKEQLTKDKYRAISDFISGMTDRYAINLYNDNK